jgi:hypothetical protein
MTLSTRLAIAVLAIVGPAMGAARLALAGDTGQRPDPTVAPAPAPASPAAQTPAASVPPASAAKPAAKPAATESRHFRTVDKMELDATAVTGNRELPKVLYIVPWKRSDLGDLVGKPMNSLVDEVLAPVDRDVFKRQLRYYGALQPDRPSAARETESKPEK